MKNSTTTPPGSLSPESQALWVKLIKAYSFDDASLLILCVGVLEPLDRMREAQRLILQDGQTILDRFGQLKQHPAILTERDSRAALLKGLKALGLELVDAMPVPPRKKG